MKIKKAHVRSLNVDMTLEELVKAGPSITFKGNLECPVCGCLLTFSSETSKSHAYLRTYRGEPHKQNCKDYFKRVEKEVEIVNGETENYHLSDNEKRSKHRHMFDLIENNGVMPQKSSPDINKDKTEKIRGKNTKKSKRIKLAPTTNKHIKSVSESDMNGQKRTIRLQYKFPGDLDNNFIGDTLEFGGFLEEIKILRNNRIDFVIGFRGKYQIVSFYEDYFVGESIGEFDRMKQLKEYLDFSSKKPAVSLIIEVRPSSKDGNYEAIIRENSSIEINHRSLFTYLGLNLGIK
ncbi:hypothetical protein [Companilactobacillus sp. HBUAS59699]|uniref:hypothetical protein n=1 Tax=Companilactobacillus sp. HBUAS59699 TaxID=3109358 RepID=UPI002FEE9C86